MKILNLYSGIGGNRKLWEGVDVTAVETILLDALEEIKDLADDGRITATFFELDKAMSEIFTKAQKALSDYASSTKEGLRWVKASERLPELRKFVHTVIDGVVKEAGEFNFLEMAGLYRYMSNSGKVFQWLDGFPAPESGQKEFDEFMTFPGKEGSDIHKPNEQEELKHILKIPAPESGGEEKCKLCGNVSNPDIHSGCDRADEDGCNWHIGSSLSKEEGKDEVRRQTILTPTKQMIDIGNRWGLAMHDSIQSYHIANAMEDYKNNQVNEVLRTAGNAQDRMITEIERLKRLIKNLFIMYNREVMFPNQIEKAFTKFAKENGLKGEGE